MQKSRLGFRAVGLVSALASVALGSVVLVGQGFVDKGEPLDASVHIPLVAVEVRKFEPVPLPWPRPFPPIPRPIPPLEPLPVLQEKETSFRA